MKLLYTTALFAFLLASCASSKYDTSPTTSSVEKLIKKHTKKPEDTAVLNRLVFGYDLLHQQYTQEINTLSARNTPQAWESIANLYSKLIDLNDNTVQNAELASLLQPKDYSADMAYAKQQAADGYYAYATDQLYENTWRSARAAYTNLNKVKSLASNYKDVNTLLPQARELGTVDILVGPVRTEGLFFNTNYNNTNGYKLAEQLTNDMGGEFYTNGRFRVYVADRYSTNKEPNWAAEPLWTNWRVWPMETKTYNKTVSKNVQVGKDSASKPIYKTVEAVVTVTEKSLRYEGTMELRVNDLQDKSSIGRRSWTEQQTWKQTTATYSGSKDALSDDDWNMIKQSVNNRPSENKMQLDILQKIYPDMLRWFKNIAE